MSGANALTAARVYSVVVITAGAGLLLLRIPALTFDQPWLFLALLAGSSVISAVKVHLPLPRGAATLSMSYFTDFLALILLGPDEGMVVAGVSGAAQCLVLTRGRPSVRRTLFSAATLMIAMQVTALAAQLLGGFAAGSPLLVLSRVTIAAAAVFFLVNSGLIAIVVAVSRQAPIVRTWHQDFLWTAPACLIGAVIAVLLTRASGAQVVVLAMAAGALFVTFQAYRIYLGRVEEQQQHLKEISDLHLASVEALARAIDARDQTIDHARAGENHIRRLQAWAVALADAAGMRPDEIEAVKVAALLHDIGKLAVPEHILTKPGPLTAKEFARVRVHPIVGAEIIKAVPFPYPVAPLIRSHHERWDGKGYPDGLRGEATPLGARVLAVVDCFDAISSTRPYHGPARIEDAIATLREEAGRTLDPTLVDLFLAILPTLQGASPGAPARPDAQPAAANANAAATLAPAGPGRSAPAWVFHDIALATQEMRALHDIAQTLGTRLSVDDTMALLTAKLSRLIPGSCWVLFLHDRVDDVLRCRFATGLSPEVTSRLAIPFGEGASGWAARQRTPILNADASRDFLAAGMPPFGPPFESALAYPLVDGDDLIGTLTVYHAEREPFRDEHRQVLEHISAQVASVLRNAVAFERMRDVSFTDPLTELPNSRALAEYLRRRVVDTPGAPVPSALIMIDLDDFKAVNDGHGHQKGDAALYAVASAIRNHVRGSDFCARYGGDEFVAVLSGCDRAEAEQRARDLQAAVGLIEVDSPQGRLHLGISVGVSVFPDDGATIDSLITAADRRMYLDKSARRMMSDQGFLNA